MTSSRNIDRVREMQIPSGSYNPTISQSVGNTSSNMSALPSVNELFSGENWFKVPLSTVSSSSADIELDSVLTSPSSPSQLEKYSFAPKSRQSSVLCEGEATEIMNINAQFATFGSSSFSLDDTDQIYGNHSSPEESHEINTHTNDFNQVRPSNTNLIYLGQPNYVSKRHICHLCQKRFPRPSSLRVHLHTHTGEKPYICEYPNCKRSFSVLSNLRRHSKTHTV